MKPERIWRKHKGIHGNVKEKWKSMKEHMRPGTVTMKRGKMDTSNVTVEI